MSQEDVLASIDKLLFELCEMLDLKAGLTLIVRPNDRTGRTIYLRLEPQHGHPSVTGLAPGSYAALQQALGIYEKKHTALLEQAQGTLGQANATLAHVESMVAKIDAARALLHPASLAPAETPVTPSPDAAEPLDEKSSAS